MTFDHGRFGRGVAHSFLKALILGALFTSAAIAGAAEDPGRSIATGSVIVHASPSGHPADGTREQVQKLTETEADRFFRTWMLPGTAGLVLFVAITLTAVFYPKSETA
jgi:hypothetical protein